MTRSWDIQSKPLAAGFDEDKHVCLPGADGALYIVGLGKKDVSHLKEFTLAIDKGKGKR